MIVSEHKPAKQREIERLTSMGLPVDYFHLNHEAKKSARMASLHSWYDTSLPQYLLTDTPKFVQALRLWVEFYQKPAQCNRSMYFYPDPLHKYDMVERAFSPAKEPGQPSKFAGIAWRGSTKSVTFIRQAAFMIAVCRPRTQIIISEMNQALTEEFLLAVKEETEDNEIIHADFGGRGTLFPQSRTTRDKWNNAILKFPCSGSSIQAVSVMSKHRGRHPHLHIIDDADDGEVSKNPEWRKKYWRWLFNVAMKMLGPGAWMIWFQTKAHAYSPISLAVRGVTETRETIEEEEQDLDSRFDDWHKARFRPWTEDADGNLISLWPAKQSVEQLERERELSPHTFALEMLADDIAEGSIVFNRDSFKHGYMHCQNDDGQDYFLDLKTGDTAPWNSFLEELWVCGAGDLADSIRADACPGAAVILGIDPQGIIYVLDVFNKRCHADTLVVHVLETMCPRWGCSVMGWEEAALQTFIVRYALRHTRIMQREGKVPPIHEAIKNQMQHKNTRIIAALQPLLTDCEIRFPYFRDFTDVDGTVHKPMPHHGRRYIRDLLQQVDMFTDEGGAGYVDAIDALEMAIRLMGRRKGVKPAVPEGKNEAQVKKWQAAGVDMSYQNVPSQLWTPSMVKDHEESMMASMAAPAEAWDEGDLYDV